MNKVIFVICFLFASGQLAAQNITIRGTVFDAKSNEAVPFASIAAIDNATAEVIVGTTSKLDGSFELKLDSIGFYVEVRFVGYATKKITSFNSVEGQIELGKLLLEKSSLSLNEVEIVAEKSTVEFKLDKRVFNVGSDISSSGMGALEVLNNVPSVNVDIEGAISLRGNSGVQILINGKPSVLTDEGSNALGTITADMIESVEVITNPSAKYEAEGSAGIINIIIKKQEKKALNGSISLNTGYPNNHSVGLSLNQRTEKFNLFAQLGAGYRTRPYNSHTINQSLVDNSLVESLGEEFKNENFYNVILGTDFYINDLNVITLTGNFAYEIESEESAYDFTLSNGDGQIESEYQRAGITTATNPKYQFDLQYAKEFKNNKDHQLLLSTTGHFFGKDQASAFENVLNVGSFLPSDQKIETDFHQADYAFKLDYTNPISKKFTYEGGGLYEINDIGNDYKVFDNESDSWVESIDLSNNFLYIQKVLGVYSTGSIQLDKWGFKAGLRLENTDLETALTTTNEYHSSNYTNLFPSAHVSYKISKRYSMQAGYSKRISRPRMWDLNPFFNIQNSYSIKKGNPNLAPEYSDSYELTSIFILDKLSLNASLYFLHTENVMEQVTYFEDNISTTTPENIGVRDQTGLEFNAKYKPFKWFTLSGDFNYGYFNRVGTFESQVFDFNGDKWSSKMTGKFKVSKTIDFELTGNYQSTYKTVQGITSGFLYGNLGLRKKLWKGKGVLNFTVQDIFASRVRESTVSQTDFYYYSIGSRGRFFTLGFSYSFGKGEAMTYSGSRRF
ncbi:TonB-dependent receptor [Putridiphycobacter roseus]|uniref:TonB-dependent receptor n=1 Tax=Putridiphycobacter roseus TaxID=2219161 RepID=A0A2W1NAU1_9FLAO|nr:TonB-dependent receptor [Putridiphycobacter roseus]PZE16163.1 TonB-dependent receptor [Putridiphycobacter roseus]